MAAGLDGKRALVTGAAAGIGRATAERLKREGARVAAVDVTTVDWQLALTADVSDEPQVEASFHAATEALGGLDIVVANAAVQFAEQDRRADELELDVW